MSLWDEIQARYISPIVDRNCRFVVPRASNTKFDLVKMHNEDVKFQEGMDVALKESLTPVPLKER